MSAIETIGTTLTNTPLSSMVENMGLSIATAQAALDGNSIEMLKKLAFEKVEIGGNEISLLNLGFIPSFYTFTEASFEAKMEFSLSESTSFEVGGGISVTTAVFGMSVNANYARKFDQSASASSSIAARMVSLPPPENLISFLRKLTTDESKTTESIN